MNRDNPLIVHIPSFGGRARTISGLIWVWSSPTRTEKASISCSRRSLLTAELSAASSRRARTLAMMLPLGEEKTPAATLRASIAVDGSSHSPEPPNSGSVHLGGLLDHHYYFALPARG